MTILPPGATPAPAETKERIQSAARDFEALLIEQMLRTARETAQTSLDGESDAARETALDMADQEVARLMARQGGLGLAAMITRHVKPTRSADAAPPEPPAAAGPPVR